MNGDQCFGVKSTKTDSAVAWTNGRTVDENIANARLIAAAPDMLAALELMYSNAGESPEWIRARIEKVIKSAKGE